MNTTDRYASRERMIVWDADACAVALTAHPLRRLASYQRKMGFLGMLVYARGDSLAENRAM